MAAIETTKLLKRAYTVHYTDNRQTKAYVEWANGARTEGEASRQREPVGTHMRSLFARAEREGLTVEHQTW